MTRMLCRLALTVAVTACMTGVAHARQTAGSAGRIKVVKGEATIVRGGQARPAAVGDEVLASDILRTGSGSHLGITLRDETRLSLGPGSEVSLTTFTFTPTESRYEMALRVVRGALAYVSGRIARLAPDRVRLETPSLVIGVRGTHALIKVEAP